MHYFGSKLTLTTLSDSQPHQDLLSDIEGSVTGSSSSEDGLSGEIAPPTRATYQRSNLRTQAMDGD